MAREDEVRLIAYRIWEEEGCVDGRDSLHWIRAEAIWEQQQKQKTVTQSTVVGSKKTSNQATKVIGAKKKIT
jgi:hypothetical protein